MKFLHDRSSQHEKGKRRLNSKCTYESESKKRENIEKNEIVLEFQDKYCMHTVVKAHSLIISAAFS